MAAQKISAAETESPNKMIHFNMATIIHRGVSHPGVSLLSFFLFHYSYIPAGNDRKRALTANRFMTFMHMKRGERATVIKDAISVFTFIALFNSHSVLHNTYIC